MAALNMYWSTFLARIGTVRAADQEQRLWLVFSVILCVGALITLLNLDLPIIRNAFSYAKAALSIVDNHFNLVAVVKDPTWSAGKPVFFSILAAPLVAAFGANTGTVITSSLGTAFFLWMTALFLLRLNRRTGLSPSLVPLAFALVTFNPLVIYQFWSAYPDSLFAGLVLLAWILVDIVATEPQRDTRWHIVGLGLTLYVAIHTKLYGAILAPACALYLLMHWRGLIHGVHRVSKLAMLAAIPLILAAVLLLAKLQLNPFLQLEARSGYDSSIWGLLQNRSGMIVGSVRLLGFAVLLLFHAALFFMVRSAAWSVWLLPPTVFAAVYLLGLLTFSGTQYNLRYFLPVLPFLGIPLAAGAYSMSSSARRIVLGVYGAIALCLILDFNLLPVHRLLQPIVPQLTAEGKVSPLDNFRLPEQVKLKQQIDWTNATVPSGAVLYWASDYNDTATHGLGRHLGFKDSLNIRYVLAPAKVPVQRHSVFLTGLQVTRTALTAIDHISDPPDWAIPVDLGSGLFRLDPFFVECTSETASAAASGLRLRLTAADSLGVANVEFWERDKILGSVQHAPFELDWSTAPVGRHEILARATTLAGESLVAASAACRVTNTPAATSADAGAHHRTGMR